MIKVLYGHHFAANESMDNSVLDKWFGSSLETFIKFVKNNQGAFSSIEQIDKRGHAMVLTLDDGYKSIKTEVLPVLEKYDIPCTLFTRTDVLDGKIPYELCLANLFLSKKYIMLTNGEIIRTNSYEKAEAVYQNVRKQIKFQSIQKRRQFVKEMYEKNKLDIPIESPIPFLSWNDIKELSDHPLITIGAHTKNHPALKKHFTRADYQEICSEKSRLERHIGKEISHFAYPYGAHNFLSRFLVKRCGYHYAFTTKEAAYVPESISNFSIPRYNIESLYSI